jgi:hypothetical protein
MLISIIRQPHGENSFLILILTNISENSTSQYPVESAVTGLVRGIVLGMASGEKPVSLVTANIQVQSN